jgi:hypothetical protein
MEVRIGVVHTPKELTIEADGDADSVIASIEAAIKAGDTFVWLEDGKGHKIGVTTEKISYIEVQADDESRKVGFGR